MLSLILLSVLQNMATGAYIAACFESGTMDTNWPAALFLVVCNLAFIAYLVREAAAHRRLANASEDRPCMPIW